LIRNSLLFKTKTSPICSESVHHFKPIELSIVVTCCQCPQVIGTPNLADLDFISNPKAQQYVASLPPRPPVSWEKLYPDKDHRLLDMLDKLLAFNPAARLTVEQALAHPYLEAYYDPSDEPVAETPFKFEVEIDDLPTKTLKEMVFKEVINFKDSRGGAS